MKAEIEFVELYYRLENDEGATYRIKVTRYPDGPISFAFVDLNNNEEMDPISEKELDMLRYLKDNLDKDKIAELK